MSKPLTIIAKILAKEAKREFLKTEMLKLLPLTRKEKGCINYNLYEDNKDLNLFFFHENWECHESFAEHMQSPHLAAFLETTGEAIEKMEFNEMKTVE